MYYLKGLPREYFKKISRTESRARKTDKGDPMKDSQEKIEADALIIGGGIAGGTAALTLADEGALVILATRAKSLQESNTFYAQGGIVYEGKDLVADILAAGAGVSNPAAAKILASEGPGLVDEILINRLNVPFDADSSGLERTKEGGHGVARIIHCADETGRAIETALATEILNHPNIEVLLETTAVDLLTPAHHSKNRLAVYETLTCAGAYLLDQRTGQVARCFAPQTILATGGLGQIYQHTTNPEGARGDGIAMANRAGARIINLEYIQFHPTAFYRIGAPRYLITEMARGKGARLVDQYGNPIMDKYDPKGDLATRDIVARSLYKEMVATRASCVYLDLKSYIKREDILKDFPNIRKTLLPYGIDILEDLVPVVPAAHYSCGGVFADVETAETTVRNLFAVGEVACNGLHGANRLASTSLLEGLVFGRRAAAAILNAPIAPSKMYLNDILPWENFGNEEDDPSLIAQDLQNIRAIMWNYVGLERTTRRLARARVELSHAERLVEQFYQNAAISDSLLGLRNIARTAVLVAEAAWENKTSVGCHYRN